MDISRLIWRAGGVLTGIDRVELAYLRRFLADEIPCYFLARTSWGYVLLDRIGAEEVERALVIDEWGNRDLMSSLRRKLTPMQQAAQTFIRRHRIARCTHSRLATMLSNNLPEGIEYYNVGHSNFDRDHLTAIRAATRARLNIMVHDTIPLDFPEMQEPDKLRKFAHGLRTVAEMADRVICIADSTCKQVVMHLERYGRVPETVTAHIGVHVPEPKYSEIPEDLDLSEDYFVIAGTIEPRKNHALLLEVWETIDPNARPRLLICGKRGWLNQSVFEMLDRGVAGIVEVPDLTDGAMMAVVRDARAVLSPTMAEGFGLTPCEAAAMGVPVVCSDLDVFHEILGDYPIYLPPLDNFAWAQTIKELMATDRESEGEVYDVPTWDAHFAVVLA